MREMEEEAGGGREGVGWVLLRGRLLLEEEEEEEGGGGGPPRGWMARPCESVKPPVPLLLRRRAVVESRGKGGWWRLGGMGLCLCACGCGCG